MSAPTVDPVCPLTPTAIPLEDLIVLQDGQDASSGNVRGTLSLPKWKALLKQALQLYQAGQSAFTPTRTFDMEHDSHVKTSKAFPSNPASGRLAKCAWHARRSKHDASRLTYEEFYEGLAVDHPGKEKQYIHEIMAYDQIGKPFAAPSLANDPVSAYVETTRADVWLSQYQLPIVVTNRDFCQVFLTIELKPHADPLSNEHIDEVIASLSGQTNPSASAAGEQETNVTKRRSCINVQLPVKTSECEPKKGFVRASYGSVETLRELPDGTEWWMTVQSDSAGHIPLFFQETAMPSSIAKDVPSFIGWALKQKGT